MSALRRLRWWPAVVLLAFAASIPLPGCSGAPAGTVGGGSPGGTQAATIDDATAIDSDGDGCSDFDELNFPNFCDNDPYTPDNSARACDGLSIGAFYNDEFGYGFELPRLADLTGYDDSQGFLFTADWSITVGVAYITLHTFVNQTLESFGLDDATVLNQEVSNLYSNASFIVYSQDQVTVGGGRPGYLTVFGAVERPDVISYQLLTVHDLRLYDLQAVISDSYLNDTTEAVITDTLLSLCVD